VHNNAVLIHAKLTHYVNRCELPLDHSKGTRNLPADLGAAQKRAAKLFEEIQQRKAEN
jgi:hypothetical protein